MRAAIYEEFNGPLEVREIDDPLPAPHGAVLEVRATGVCLSDWHGWRGHDPDITLPHVPGHEMAGVVAAVGADVERWRPGDRVTVPFVCGCGTCGPCRAGDHQVCDRQTQPGFTHFGSYAERVAVEHADVNLVRLPDSLDFVAAAGLGCRFTTAYRGVVDQGRLVRDEWLAVHGCGGVGLSGILIAKALGARVVAIDIRPEALRLARSLGAEHTLNARQTDSVSAAVRDLTGGGAHVSIDAIGHPETCAQSIRSLRKRGRHVQIGILTGDGRHPPLPMGRVVAHELEIRGSHGMPAHAFERVLEPIAAGRLRPEQLVGRTVSLDEAAARLPHLGEFADTGMTIIDAF